MAKHTATATRKREPAITKKSVLKKARSLLKKIESMRQDYGDFDLRTGEPITSAKAKQ